ncbi:glutamate--cysteine ligase regulatory subunit [Nilaparvata lugens]|uniref:glutamate--cysteine ligase regulatory subunit n=1 Tax=Nilaparvata lugens TaxID=108931 RepID=UPI00193CC65A|nr:glutamate--cysteine ligase regulatory subunit [Nilaparvata lugens]
MFTKFPPSLSKICIRTGNVLNNNNFKQKAVQNPTEELVESVRVVLDRWATQGGAEVGGDQVEVHVKDESDVPTEDDVSELRYSGKVYVTDGGPLALTEAIHKLLEVVNGCHVDSLVLSYDGEDFAKLMELWSVLEDHVTANKIAQIGVADVETDTFVKLYEMSKIKPAIVQISLATCCVVPPQLQEFTNKNDVQLLTHNDPKHVLPSEAMATLLGAEEARSFKLLWMSRLLVHIKCRGVLASKSHLICIQRTPPT